MRENVYKTLLIICQNTKGKHGGVVKTLNVATFSLQASKGF